MLSADGACEIAVRLTSEGFAVMKRWSRSCILVALLTVLALPLSATDIRARTIDGRTVVLRSDRTWHYADESPSRRRIHLANDSVPLGYEYLAQIAPWLLRDATVLHALGLELLPFGSDVPDLVLHRLPPIPGGAEQTVIRLRIGDRAVGTVGFSSGIR